MSKTMFSLGGISNSRGHLKAYENNGKYYMTLQGSMETCTREISHQMFLWLDIYFNNNGDD